MSMKVLKHIRKLSTLSLSVAAAALLWLALSAGGDAPTTLAQTADTPTPVSTPAQPDIAGTGGLFSEVKGEPPASTDVETLASRFVSIDFKQLDHVTRPLGPQPATIGTPTPRTLALNLFDDVVFTGIIEHVERTVSGHAMWGSLAGVEMGAMTMVVNGSVVAGSVRTPQAVYTIRTASDGAYIIRQIDESSLLPLGEPVRAPQSAPNTRAQTASAQRDDGSEIDVMVVYTPLAKFRAGGRAGVEALIDLFVAETNQAYANSGATLRIRLVLKEEVNYIEDGDSFLDLDRLAERSDGYMDNVHNLRDLYSADLVHLVVGVSDNVCGVANGVFYIEDDGTFFDTAFGLTVDECGGLTFAHELGHNMGLEHDRYQALIEWEQNSISGSNFGYVNQRMFAPGAPESARWRTIMSYGVQCKEVADFYCPWIPHFSNPGLTYDGDPTGVPVSHPSTGVDGPAHAARTLDVNREALANFRQSSTSTPRVNLALSQYWLIENRISTVTATLHKPSSADTTVTVSVSPSDAVNLSANRTLTIPAGRRTSTGIVTLTGIDNDAQAGDISVAVSGTAVNTSSEGVIAPPPVALTIYGKAPVSQSRTALEALYNATGGPNWTENTNWGTNLPLYHWYGVYTDSEGRVTSIDLNDNGLSGQIPTELGNLSSLDRLYLDNNQLTGAIPGELGNLSNLERLYLDDNQLTGPIPSELSNLSNLEELSLWGNQLTGEIPTELANLSNLHALWLDNNQLTGTIPPELGNLSNLEHLRLHANQLTGEIPTELGNLSNLYDLWLNYNQLTGGIPEELGNLSNLERLYLNDNQLTGAIPEELGNLSNLERLYLDDNQLTGTIPAELGNLSNLARLYLHDNQLTGTIPAELGNLSNLERLYLHDNQLTGTIPAELGNLSKLERLYLNDNQLTGTIPAELGNLSKLERLYLANNQLTGCIPAALSDVAENDLEELALPFCDREPTPTPTSTPMPTATPVPGVPEDVLNRISTLERLVAELQGMIAALQGAIAGLDGRVTALEVGTSVPTPTATPTVTPTPDPDAPTPTPSATPDPGTPTPTPSATPEPADPCRIDIPASASLPVTLSGSWTQECVYPLSRERIQELTSIQVAAGDRYYQYTDFEVSDAGNGTWTATLESTDQDTVLFLWKWDEASEELVFVAANDDIVSGTNTNSRVSWTPTEGTVYYLDMTTYDAERLGDFTLTIAAGSGSGQGGPSGVQGVAPSNIPFEGRR